MKMVYFALTAPLAALLALVLGMSGTLALPLALHVGLLLGVLPLIFAAMLHFIPVLTRSGSPAPGVARIPALAQGLGALALGSWLGVLPAPLLGVAALGLAGLALVLLLWMRQRAGRCLGRPHPGWRWYAAALGCLLAALPAVPLLQLQPAWFGPLRLWHLHLNTLGLIGLAALGTLPVLLPTALGRADPQAAPWLQRALPWLGAAVLLLALGAAGWPPLAGLAGGVLLAGVLQLGWQWWRLGPGLLRDGAVCLLLSALGGLVLALGQGLAHGFGWASGQQGLLLFALGFLLPLLSGALGQLLPVWRFPGPASPARAAWRAGLVAGGGFRAGLFLLGGLALLVEWPWAGVPAALAWLLFLLALCKVIVGRGSAR